MEARDSRRQRQKRDRSQSHGRVRPARSLPETQQDNAETENERDGNRPNSRLPIANIHPPQQRGSDRSRRRVDIGSCRESVRRNQILDIDRA